MKKKRKSRPFPMWSNEEIKMPSWRKQGKGSSGARGQFGHLPSKTNREKAIESKKRNQPKDGGGTAGSV